ncbi:unnamed protein product [Closterium sp. NIES-53]
MTSLKTPAVFSLAPTTIAAAFPSPTASTTWASSFSTKYHTAQAEADNTCAAIAVFSSVSPSFLAALTATFPYAAHMDP